jgi:hypothetical protein
MNDIHHGEDPADLRHNTPPVESGPMDRFMEIRPADAYGTPLRDGEHVGNDHQEQKARLFPTPNSGPNDDGTGFFQPVEQYRAPVELPRRDGFTAPRPVDVATGLIWRSSAQAPPRTDLVNYDWSTGNPIAGPEISNIELRTVYAHLLETAGAVRAEMRERGMQVDL